MTWWLHLTAFKDQACADIDKKWRQINWLAYIYCLFSNKFFLCLSEVSIRKKIHKLEFHKYVWFTKVWYFFSKNPASGSFQTLIILSKSLVWVKQYLSFVLELQTKQQLIHEFSYNCHYLFFPQSLNHTYSKLYYQVL